MKSLHNLPKVSIIWFVIYYLPQKKKLRMTKLTYKLSLFLVHFKLILLFYAPSDCIIKIIKLLYSIPEMGNLLFTAFYLYYKQKSE